MDDIILATGRRISANRGILGLSLTESGDDLYEGYDSHADDPEGGPLTSDERHELAERAIARWKEWAGYPRRFKDRWPPWFIFGESPDGRRVDVSNGERDVLTDVPREVAETVIRERQRLLDALFAATP